MRSGHYPVVFLFVAILGGAGISGCATSQNAEQAAVSATRIDVTQLPAGTREMSAYDIVRSYKSSWLRGHGRTSINQPREVSVYLSTNSTRYGGTESLKQLRGQEIAAIEYLRSQEAQFKFGLDNPRGVIYVIMKEGQ